MLNLFALTHSMCSARISVYSVLHLCTRVCNLYSSLYSCDILCTLSPSLYSCTHLCTHSFALYPPLCSCTQPCTHLWSLYPHSVLTSVLVSVLCSRVCTHLCTHLCTPLSTHPSTRLCSPSEPDPPEFSPAQPRLVQVTEEDTAVLPLLVSANPEELTCTWLHHQDTLITGEPNQGLVIWSGVILNRS